MRPLILVFLLGMMCSEVHAQNKDNLEVALGIGTDIVRRSQSFKNDQSFFAAMFYNFTAHWGLGLCVDRKEFSFNSLPSEHNTYLDGAKPQLTRTATSFVITGRYMLPSNLTKIKSYFSLGLGFSKSASSLPGFYFRNPIDTVYYPIKSGQLILGLASFSIEFEPISPVSLFVGLQQSLPSDEDLYPVAMQANMGIAVHF
jgi:hypothetical protein